LSSLATTSFILVDEFRNSQLKQEDDDDDGNEYYIFVEDMAMIVEMSVGGVVLESVIAVDENGEGGC
jgi:hypothetical protein